MKSFVYAIFGCLFFLCSAVGAQAAITIHLISASTQYDEKEIPAIIQMLKNKGYKVDTRYLQQEVSDVGYVDSDRARGENLVNALLDNQVKYLWFVRGGGGMFNLLPWLEARKGELFNAKPKVIMGFSDVTGLHYYLNKQLHWPSLHGPMASSNRDFYEFVVPEIYRPGSHDYYGGMYNSIASLFTAIRDGVNYQGVLPLNPQASNITLQGTLYGGNLELVRSFFSTRFETGYSGNILMLEDVNVTPRQLDRTLHQLLYKQNFQPEAIIFGQFYPVSPTDEQRLMYKTVLENFARQVSYPVYYYPFFGHGVTNNPLLLCHPLTISCPVGSEKCSLQQAGLAAIAAGCP
ncbi:MAG: LD-carboxypeptidase [Enterobacteriaceae bacterium]